MRFETQRVCLYSALVLTLAGYPSQAQDSYVQLIGAMHVHSQFSTGGETLEEMAQLAREQGVDVLIASDADVLKVEYGIPFLRDLISFGRAENALFTQDKLGAYLEQLEQLNSSYPDLILIDGVESAPFYYWELDLLKRRWTVRSWSKHLVAVNLRTEGAYADLPVIGGRDKVWHWSSVLYLWPLLGLLYAFVYGRYHPRSLRLLVGAISVLCLINNFPFKVPLMDPYNGNLGPAPYQNYIEYVNENKGMVFWAHPEAISAIRPDSFFSGLFQMRSVVLPHTKDLVETRNYTGFAALYGNRSAAAEPGAQWDAVLGQYLAGDRVSPVWGIGNMDGKYNQKNSRIHDVLTVFLVRERTREAVVEAMRQGRMYAVGGGDERLVLHDFKVESGSSSGVIGEEIDSAGEIKIVVRIDKANGRREQVKLRLIKSGVVAAEINGMTPLVKHLATRSEEGERAYYRLLATSRTAKLISNPIFVTGGPQ